MIEVDMMSHVGVAESRRLLADEDDYNRRLDARRTDISAKGATYMGRLNDESYVDARDVTPRHQIVLFHYITGSAEAFLKRKYARAGKFGGEFEAMVAQSDKERADVLEDFEAEHGLDGEDELCREGASLAAAMSAARDAGEWSPLPPREGGLLFQ